MRRCTLHASCDNQRRKRVYIPGAEGVNLFEGSNVVSARVTGEVTAYLAAWLTGARMEGTTR